jgi:hypothetical protein
MSSISYINYKGKKIMYVDYTHCKNPKEMIEVLEEVKREYEKTTETFVAIADFRGNFGSSEFMKRANEIGKEILDKRTLKTAVLGVTGIKKILLNGYNAFVTHKLVPFDTKEEALEYLIK